MGSGERREDNTPVPLHEVRIRKERRAEDYKIHMTVHTARHTFNAFALSLYSILLNNVLYKEMRMPTKKQYTKDIKKRVRTIHKVIGFYENVAAKIFVVYSDTVRMLPRSAASGGLNRRGRQRLCLAFAKGEDIASELREQLS